MIERLGGDAHDTDAHGEKRLHSGERSWEMETGIIIETGGLLIEVGRLEHVRDERQVQIHFPSGGRGKASGACEGDHVHISIAFKQFDGSTVCRGSLPTLGNTDCNIEDVAGGSAHGCEFELQLKKLGIRETMGDARNNPSG